MMLLPLICYALFLIITFFYWRSSNYQLGNNPDIILHLPLLNKLYVLGIIILGLPLINYKNEHFYFLQMPVFNHYNQLILMALALILTTFIAWKNAKKETEILNLKPTEVLIHPSVIYTFFCIRVPFLIVYELFFRGVLLSATTLSFGLNFSIILNIFLYTLIHFTAKQKVLFSCIPFGFILCGFTLWFQSVWPAVLLHVSLAAISEGYLLKPFLIKKQLS